jgi:hypothetical protein
MKNFNDIFLKEMALADNTFRHLASTKDITLENLRVPTVKSDPMAIINKPKGGLWACEAKEWEDWVRGEHFNLEGFKYEYKITLKPSAKILKIISEDDFKKVRAQYKLKPPPEFAAFSTMMGDAEIGFDWKKISESYDACFVGDDVVWSMDFGHSWDVPSIVIFNKECIERFEYVGQLNFDE